MMSWSVRKSFWFVFVGVVSGLVCSIGCDMGVRELSVSLREMARRDGLCDEWYGAWGDDEDVDSLLDRYVRGFDFAVKHDYPALEFIRKYFRREDLHRHGIFLDEEVSLPDASNGTYIFLGSCTGEVRFGEFKAASLYLRHGSRLRVVVGDLSKVFITCYECSAVDVSSAEHGFVKVYDRGKGI